MKPYLVSAAVGILALAVLSSAGMAAPKGDITPSAQDKCPVCGMFVAKYPDWTAYTRFTDGSTSFFDGPKDMFFHYFNAGRYTPGRKQGDITRLAVKEYYSLKMIDAKSAFFVIGSDVYGPMGGELIPFATQKDAADFVNDHRGKRIIRFNDVTLQLLNALK